MRGGERQRRCVVYSKQNGGAEAERKGKMGMKANGVEILQYRAEEDRITLVTDEAAAKELVNRDDGTVTIEDESGVTEYVNCRLRRVNLRGGRGVVEFAADPTAAEIAALKQRLNEQADALIELAELTAGEV